MPVLTAKANSVLNQKKFILQNLMKIIMIMSPLENYTAFLRSIRNDSRDHEFALSELHFSKNGKNFIVPCISNFLIIASPREQVLGDVFPAQVVEYTLCLVISNSQEHITQSKQLLCLLRTDNKKEFCFKKIGSKTDQFTSGSNCKIDTHFWTNYGLCSIVLSSKINNGLCFIN